MIEKLIPIIIILISGYFVLSNNYLGFSLIIFMASSIYFGYVIREGKGKEEERRSFLPPPQQLNISMPKGYGSNFR